MRTSDPSRVMFALAIGCCVFQAGESLAQPALAPAPAEAAPATSRVDRVTLYRGQALVMHVEGPAGAMEVAVGPLPERAVMESLYAEGEEGVEVRAVRGRVRAVGAEPREEVRKLDVQIEAAREAIELAEAKLGSLGKRTDYLDKLDQFTASSARADLAKGTLDAVGLQKVSEFTFAARDKVLQDSLDLKGKLKGLREQVELLNRQRAELAGRSVRQVQEAVVFIQKTQPARQALRISYLVEGCGWSPSYNLRAAAQGDAIRIEYNAMIQQITGEDWKDVALTLSTATPALSAQGPALAMFEVSLTRPQPGRFPTPGPEQAMQQADIAAATEQQLKEVAKRQQAAATTYLNTIPAGENFDSLWAFNLAANDRQLLELNTSAEQLRHHGQQELSLGASFDYELPTRADIPSRSDMQMVRVVQTELAGKTSHIATPVLSPHVYRQAEMTNTTGKDLLGGPVSVYLGNRFVGRAEIETVARGQSFVVGFGADAQIRSKRELVDRSEELQGGNRKLVFSYRLSIENFKAEPVTVQLYDRRPYARRAADIRVGLTTTLPLSEDATFKRVEAPKGLLRWDVKAPAQAAGEKALALEYTYTLEFDRTLSIGSPNESGQKLQEEFKQIQQLRNRK